jgi:DNA mismatch repair ATPase MutS
VPSSHSAIVLPVFKPRETSSEDGVAIAWSVAEHLLSKGAMTFFATHYPQICRMSQVYPSVRNQHLEATMPEDVDGRILYTHKIRNGPCKVASSYGVHVAASTGFPDDVLEEVRSFAIDRITLNIFRLLTSFCRFDTRQEQ